MVKKTNKQQPNRSISSIATILLGVILLLIGLQYHVVKQKSLSFHSPYTATKRIHNNNVPIKISIPKIQVTLQIKETGIKNGIWEIYENGASHLNKSANPNDKKPIIIYSHNRDYQFGKIGNLQKGNFIILSTIQNESYIYKVSESITVDPSRIDVLSKPKRETLILYTCTGFADSKRLIVYADRIE